MNLHNTTIEELLDAFDNTSKNFLSTEGDNLYFSLLSIMADTEALSFTKQKSYFCNLLALCTYTSASVDREDIVVWHYRKHFLVCLLCVIKESLIRIIAAHKDVEYRIRPYLYHKSKNCITVSVCFVSSCSLSIKGNIQVY